MIYTNIDRNDEALGTNYPFELKCPLQLGYVTLPRNAFISVRLYLSESHVAPARLSKVVMGAEKTDADVYFTDAYSRLIGTWRIYRATADGLDYVSGIVYDSYGIISGLVTVDKALPSVLYSACAGMGGEVSADLSDFILLPQCCVPMYKGKCKSFIVDGVATTANLKLTTGKQIPCSQSGGTVTVEALGVCPYAIDSGATTVQINPNRITALTVGDTVVDVRGRHLIVKAGVTSNLRVTCGTDLIFSGVLDE